MQGDLDYTLIMSPGGLNCVRRHGTPLYFLDQEQVIQ
jgi:hypothetical protein